MSYLFYHPWIRKLVRLQAVFMSSIYFYLCINCSIIRVSEIAGKRNVRKLKFIQHIKHIILVIWLCLVTWLLKYMATINIKILICKRKSLCANNCGWLFISVQKLKLNLIFCINYLQCVLTEEIHLQSNIASVYGLLEQLCSRTFLIWSQNLA